MTVGRGPGWDAQEIHRIARDRYGSLKSMFEFHGWPETGSRMVPAVQRRVVDSYGSVDSFVSHHEKDAP